MHFRNCLFHASKKAISWSGHVHLNEDDRIVYIVGLCKECRKLSFNRDSNCRGCFGTTSEVH